MWLGEVAGDHAAQRRPAPVGTVRLWPLSRAVNNLRNNGSELLAPIVDAGPETAEEARRKLDVGAGRPQGVYKLQRRNTDC